MELTHQRTLVLTQKSIEIVVGCNNPHLHVLALDILYDRFV